MELSVVVLVLIADQLSSIWWICIFRWVLPSRSSTG